MCKNYTYHSAIVLWHNVFTLDYRVILQTKNTVLLQTNTKIILSKDNKWQCNFVKCRISVSIHQVAVAICNCMPNLPLVGQGPYITQCIIESRKCTFQMAFKPINQFKQGPQM